MVSRILSSAAVQRTLARAALSLLPPVVKLRNNVFVLRWKDVADVLARDDDFRIEPVNRDRIESVSGPFFLGLDRQPAYFAQRAKGYGAMAALDFKHLREAVDAEAIVLINKAGKDIEAVGGYARDVAARTAMRVFGVHGPDEASLKRVARAVFHETFLNLGGDKEVRERGVAAGVELSQWTREEIADRRRKDTLGMDFLGAMLSEPGDLNDDEIAHILNGYLIGSIDTTATATTNILKEIISDPDLRRAATADLDHPTRILGWCLEALRRRPHNPLLVRQPPNDTVIGGVDVPAGSRVFAITLSAQMDPAAFPNPTLMDPTRPRDRYMHFGYGPHMCAGRDLNALQIPLLVGHILRRNPVSVGPITYDGPFPDAMRVSF